MLCQLSLAGSPAEDRPGRAGRYRRRRVRGADPPLRRSRRTRSRACGWSPPRPRRRRRLEYAREDGGWRLSIPDPGVERLEYELELEHADGDTETINDPGNPLRAPGAFGEKSVAELPGYAPPAWLDAPKASTGRRSSWRSAPARCGARSTGACGARPAREPADPLPLLVANDGPEYADLAGLTAYAAAMIEAGRLPPHRIALLRPTHRDEWYSASTAYSRALAHRGGARAARARARPRGCRRRSAPASAAWRCCTPSAATRTCSAGCSCSRARSSSPGTTRQESGFPRFRRIVAFTRATLGRRPASRPRSRHADLRRARGERPQQPPDGARARGAGLPGASCTSSPTCTTSPPGATRWTRTSPTCWTRHGPLREPGRRRRDRARPLRPAACSPSPPSAAARTTSRPTAWSAPSHGLIEAGPGEDLLRGLQRRRQLVRHDDPARGPRPRPRLLRDLDPRPRRAVHPRRPAGRRPRSSPPAAAWAPSTPPTSRSSAPTASRSRCASAATTTPARGTAGASAATQTYFNNPSDYVHHLDGDHLELAALAHQPAARLRPGPVGGHHGRAGEHPAAGRRAGRQGHPA